MPETKVAHTPGPWRTGARSCEWNSPSSPYLHVDGERGPLIAKVRQWQLRDTVGAQECEANARLIAAAPEMYEALKDLIAAVAHLLYACEHHDQSEDVKADFEQWRAMAAPDPLEAAEAALAKAEGR